MKIIVCKCAQCRGSKKRKSSSQKKRIKRMLNKKRRRNLEGKVYTHTWA
jgi:hypothetical protein